MPGFGYRSGTRYAFKRGFRDQGRLPLLQYTRPIKTGDIVEVVVNSMVHKGMPHKTYHGRTGIVFNVAKRAVGVEVKKVVRNRIEMKRINVRIEHVRPSKCRSDFLNRVKIVDSKLREAKIAKIRLPVSEIKRAPTAPKAAFQVARSELVASTITTLKPTKFDDML